MASKQQHEEESKTIPLKMLVDKQRNKVVFVEATKDFVDTLFSFLSIPLGTIVCLLATNNNNDQQNQQPQSESSPLLGRIRNLCKYFVATLFSFLFLPLAAINNVLSTNNNDQQQLSESSPFLRNINNLYQSVQNTTLNDVWNNEMCKQMLLCPRNPCEALCLKLFLNVDDTEPSSNFFVCDSCYKFTNFENLNCTCGKPPNREPVNLDSQGLGYTSQNRVFVRESGPMFLVSDDLKIVPSSMLSSLEMLVPLGYSDLTQLEEVTHNIGKQEILNLLKHTLTSHEPLTNTILGSSSKNRNNPPNQFASAVGVMQSTNDIRKMDVKVMLSKSQKNIIYAEGNGDFVDFIFSFLTMPLGSIVKLLGPNSFAGCVGNLYKSVENLDPTSVLLNPGIAPEFGCPNQPLNIPVQPPPTYYYGPCRNTDHDIDHYYSGLKGVGVISKSRESVYSPRPLIALDPRESAVGFVKKTALYGIGNDLKVKPVSAKFCLSYLKKQNLPLDDLEVKVISIGEVEALSLLGASLTSNFTLTSGFADFLNVPKQE